MNYSINHQRFAGYYASGRNRQDVLDNPENYLGQNYKEVLNWWFYWDSMCDKQKSVYWERFCDLDDETWKKARKTAVELAKEVIDSRFVVWLCAWELEIIAAHLYIERGIPFTITPLIFDL